MTTDDERFVILVVSERGKGNKGNALYVRDLSRRGEKTFPPLVPTIGDDAVTTSSTTTAQLLVSTDRDAPRGRSIAIDPRSPSEATGRSVIAERPRRWSVNVVGDKRSSPYLKDATRR